MWATIPTPRPGSSRQVIRYLVEKGGSNIVNCADFSKCTPLLIAAQYGQADVVAYLIKINADTTILDKNKDSAMHWAAYKGVFLMALFVP